MFENIQKNITENKYTENKIVNLIFKCILNKCNSILYLENFNAFNFSNYLILNTFIINSKTISLVVKNSIL